MRCVFRLALLLSLVPCGSGVATAAAILVNGNLDLTDPAEVTPGVFLAKPADWVNEGIRSIAGPYEDEMSSQPWAGPAPTPVTADGTGNQHPNGCGGLDCGVFFRPFTGSVANGAATGHLYQDNPATSGLTYTLTGWAGAEANFLGRAVFAIEFLDAGHVLLASSGLDLVGAGLFVANGQPFNYKQFTVMATAPAGTATVRARASMLGGTVNPLGGGQAFVVDDFELTDDAVVVPEPATAWLALVGLLDVARRRRRARTIR